MSIIGRICQEPLNPYEHDLHEHLRELIREDQKRRSKERLEALLLEGLDSGDPIPADAKFWTELKREAVAKLASRKKSGSRTDRPVNVLRSSRKARQRL